MFLLIITAGVILAIFLPVLRFLIGLLIIWTFFSLFDHSNSAATVVPTTEYFREISYEDLKKYPVSCDKKDQQLAELTKLQRSKNFNPDPEKLEESDRIFNSRLKATIWWYTYSCVQS